ncbi:hypothetical protein CAter282_2141 [Collimonas arenae]|uniref:Uncharacterized protein n=1 Tax=Collimonas arenae TaxID=279058 RepID=A0A127PQF4_9BURK|nr:hypothetical protein CAter10_2333 [Collimonas arenae]AMP09897.1 hypothetical protein CAter282_2141 [Collimonas arenae]
MCATKSLEQKFCAIALHPLHHLWAMVNNSRLHWRRNENDGTPSIMPVKLRHTYLPEYS